MEIFPLHLSKSLFFRKTCAKTVFESHCYDPTMQQDFFKNQNPYKHNWYKNAKVKNQHVIEKQSNIFSC